MDKIKRNSQSGFTFIEILTVVAILGILAAGSFVWFNGARLKARNTQRFNDLRMFQQALTVFHSKYGVYPCGDAFISGYFVDHSSSEPFLDGLPEGETMSECDDPMHGLYREGLIRDPWITGPTTQDNGYDVFYGYSATEDRKSYILYTIIENGDSYEENDGGLCNYWYEVGPGTGTIPPYTSGSKPCN